MKIRLPFWSQLLLVITVALCIYVFRSYDPLGCKTLCVRQDTFELNRSFFFEQLLSPLPTFEEDKYHHLLFVDPYKDCPGYQVQSEKWMDLVYRHSNYQIHVLVPSNVQPEDKQALSQAMNVPEDFIHYYPNDHWFEAIHRWGFLSVLFKNNDIHIVGVGSDVKGSIQFDHQLHAILNSG